MRAKRRVFALSLLTFLFTGIGFSVVGQDSSPTEGEMVVDLLAEEAKLIAEQTALTQLVGKGRFVLRESSWGGEIEPGKVKLVQVQLFKRNDYRFWLAVPDRRGVVNLSLYDGNGEFVRSAVNEPTPLASTASLSISPDQTGTYYVRLVLQGDLDAPQRWSLIYAYR